MTNRILTLCFLFLTFGVINADFQITDWEYFKLTKISENTKEGYVKSQIDKEVFAQSQQDIRDIRIIDNQQKEIPYKLVKNYQILKETLIQSELFNKSFVPEDKTTFMLDLGSEYVRLNNRVVINTPDHNFKRKVEISGGDDRHNWHTLKDNCYIFDFTTKEFQSSCTTLEYPDNNYQYLQIIIWDKKDKSLEITNATVYHRTIQKAEEHLIPFQLIDQRVNTKLKAFELILDLGSPGQPQYRIEITPQNENYHRQVEIRGTNDIKTDWNYLGNGYAYNFNTPQFVLNRNNIDYKENGYRFLKISVIDYDDQPLNFSADSIKVYGIVNKIIFNYKNGCNYLLYYGNPFATKATYDIEKLFPYLETSNIGELKLEKGIKNSQYKIPPKPKKPWSEEHAYLIWVILSIAIIIMGFVIIKWSKNIKETPENSTQK
ncbi:MAG: DUF3999 family protein [Planctomycetota bacterium]